MQPIRVQAWPPRLDRIQDNVTEGETGLAGETDFLEMYRTLGLRPGCSLPELKQAYRRQVSRMHPDRKAGVQNDPVIAVRLQRLIAQYDAAMVFEREHGRLPGSVARARFTVTEVTDSTFTYAPPAPHRSAWRNPVLLLLVPAALLGALGVDIASHVPSNTASDDTASPAPAVRPLGDAAPAPSLSLGITSEDVRSMLGEPDSVHGDRWEYGPSWVRFENGRVSDWYSSPLRELGATARTPNAEPTMSQDARN